MRTSRLPPPARSQRGAALLIFVIALVLAATYALLKKVNQTPGDAASDLYTMKQLKVARDALRGYALHGLDPVSATVQPGRLPCPDYTLDGDSDGCVIASGHVQPGRLPWRTLGLAELRDADNEPLWYVPAIEFNGSQVINSNSNNTTLRVDGGTDAMIAIVLSPGAVLANQSRPPGNLANQLDPSRYFEDVNALATTTYVTAPANSNTPFNDRLLAIRLNRFMPELERRVLRELKNILKAASAFPNPADIGSTDCKNTNTEGLVPTTISLSAPCDVDITTLPVFPGWFAPDWQPLIWYAMDTSAGLNVSPIGGGASTSAQALLFSSGAVLSGQNRLPVTSASDLLEGTENTNGPPNYEEPVNSLINNDQLLIVAP